MCAFVVVLLCARSSPTTAETHVHSGSLVAGPLPAYHDRGPRDSAETLNASEVPRGRANAPTAEMTMDVVRPSDGAGVEDGHRALDDRFVVVAGSLRPPPVFTANDTDGGGDERYGLEATVVDTGTSGGLHADLGRIKYRKMNRNNYLKSKMNKMVAEEDISTGYQNAYDLTYNSGGYGLKEYDNPETSWSGSVGESGNWNQLPYKINDQHSAAAHKYYGFKAPSSPTKYHHKPIHHKENTVDWKKISILAFIKLALAKLQAIGFLKILFLLGFKFMLYVKAIIFKFIFLMKKMKFFKILGLPLFVIKFLPTFIQLLSMMGQLFDIGRRPAYNIPGFPESNTLPTNVLGGLLPNRPGTTGTGIVTGNSGTGLTGGTISNRPARISSSSSRLDDLNLINRQYYQLVDPTIDIFQKVLDSEKCVERIACRIAAAKKAGILPFWINWMLHRISKFIPNKKLEFYFKTYNDVNNEIHNKSTTLDNWANWCSEHYDCSINSIMNTK